MKQRVHFLVQGDNVVGDLYLPAADAPHPAVIVAGPMTSVKEQVTGVYASALATRGVAALALDHRHFGESGGQPRQYEHHGHKIEDLRAALDWMAEQPYLDASRLGLAAVCLGSGYAAWASIENPHVRALGMVAGYYRDPTAMREADRAGFDRKIQQGIEARELYERTGELRTVPAAARRGDAAMTLEDTYDYYATSRAGVPNYTNAFAVMSREHFVPFDVQAAAEHLHVPVLMVHSKNALSPHWAEAFFERIRCTKRLEWLESRGQVDVYDDPVIVRQAADRLARHFGEHLGITGLTP